jgi:hypothetical protein
MDRTTTSLLAAIREQGRLVYADPETTDANLLLECNRQLTTVFVPMLRHARSEWYVTYQDQTLEQDEPWYSIPDRAISSTVRTVLWLPSGGQELELVPVPLTEQHLYRPSTGMPCVYTIQDDRITVLPTPSANLGTLRVWYERAPSALALTSTCSQVVSVDSSSATQVEASVNSGTDLGAPGYLDIVSVKAPYSLKGASQLLGSIVSNTVTWTRSGDSRVPAVGDWVCPYGTTPIPNLPDELHPLLSLAVAGECLTRFDPAAGSILKAELAEAMGTAQSLLASRQLGRQQKLKSQHSMMRRGGSGRRRAGFGDWRA